MGVIIATTTYRITATNHRHCRSTESRSQKTLGSPWERESGKGDRKGLLPSPLLSRPYNERNHADVPSSFSRSRKTFGSPWERERKPLRSLGAGRATARVSSPLHSSPAPTMNETVPTYRRHCRGDPCGRPSRPTFTFTLPNSQGDRK